MFQSALSWDEETAAYWCPRQCKSFRHVCAGVVGGFSGSSLASMAGGCLETHTWLDPRPSASDATRRRGVDRECGIQGFIM